MELRHLRYFVAVAEEGSLTVAAEKRLHTAQPSLSRQIRDLEQEVGTDLFTRGVRGVVLTPAGKAFLDHARMALTQVEVATNAARQAAAPARKSFSAGFLTGQEMDWLPEAARILRDELPNIQLSFTSQYSPDLAAALQRFELDLAFMRREDGAGDLVFRTVAREPLLVVMPSDHRLAQQPVVHVTQLAGETFIGVSSTAPALQTVMDDYIHRSGVDLTATHEIDNLAMAISMVASTRGVTILPLYAKNFLPWSVTSRPLAGEAPTIDLVIGYHPENPSPMLALFLSRLDELAANVARRLPDLLMPQLPY